MNFPFDSTTLEPVLRQVHSWDISILHQINLDWAHPALDTFFVCMASFGLLKWPLLLAAVLLLVFGKFRERTLIVLTLLALLVGDAGISSALKATFNRPRPFQSQEGVRHVRLDQFTVKTEWSSPGPVEKGRSLPSSHTCNNAAFATIVTLLYPPWGALAWIWAFLMALSRVYTGDHYPSDVLLSLPLALIYTLLICCVASRIWQWLGPRFMPQIAQKHPRLFPRAF